MDLVEPVGDRHLKAVVDECRVGQGLFEELALAFDGACVLPGKRGSLVSYRPVRRIAGRTWLVTHLRKRSASGFRLVKMRL